jgi:hypothetical protein
MFKKKCSKCKNKIEKGFDFCPYCGMNLKKPNDHYGLLGNNDEEPLAQDPFDLPVEKLLGKMIKSFDIPSMMRQLEQGTNTNNPNNNLNKNGSPFPPGMKIKFAINGKEVDLNPQPQKNKIAPKKIIKTMSEDNAKKFAELPRKEPASKMKRLSNKIVYELETPGVENLGDVVINKLETSIEIKALSKDKVYTKTLNIDLPIIRYGLNKGNLILEFQAK